MGSLAEVDTPVDVTPFHPGEQYVQRLTGARHISEQLGRQWIGPTLSPQTQAFSSRQPFLFTATKDQEGLVWASVLAGNRGFMTAPDNKHLHINDLRIIPGDPSPFVEGQHIGTVAIELHTRKRERLNGVIAARDASSLTIRVEQSFAGCPKYIQAREVGLHADSVSSIGQQPCEMTTGGAQLGDYEQALVLRSDTFFLATTYDEEIDPTSGVATNARGLDTSHRGGAPGFVQVADEAGTSVIRWADYVGNFTFTTLGNIHSNPAVGLVFVDFDSGDTLQVSGRAEILWDDHSLPGAERVIQVHVQRWVCVHAALPVKVLSEPIWSPYNPPPTCKFDAGVGKNVLKLLNNNYVDQTATIKYLTCLSVRDETPDVRTYQFMAPIAKRSEGFWPYKAGQYASFDLEDVPDPKGREGRVLNRTWTLSSHPSIMASTSAITVSVKKVGLVSNWLWDNMKRGSTIAFRGIEGTFTADAVAPGRPVQLIAGGIGITPLRAMFHEFCSVRSADTVLLYSVHTLQDAAFLSDLVETAKASPKAAIYLTTTREAPQPDSSTGYVHLHGRVDADMLLSSVPDVLERDVLLCGPPGFMQAVTAALESLHFPSANLHTESFFF